MTFLYWALDGEEYEFTVMPKGGVELVAVYEGDSFNITVADNDNVTIDVSNSAKYGSTVTVTVTVADGYEITDFEVLVTNSDIEIFMDNDEYSFVMPAEDVTISVEVEVINYLINYKNVDGATNTNAISYSTEEVVTFSNIEKEGYKFEGWYLDAEFTTKITSTEGKMGDLTLYAKFVEDAKGGCGGAIASSTGMMAMLGAVVDVAFITYRKNKTKENN